ncbi:uncharacterized protein EAE98_003109 [Botrytis deweyae]|uniref:Uncharacterized protein n=1 Tax=Botrytis deweyae TaxID=2478750 RepID=A0ABQ7IVN9_9HELO|nr:uncharacterized protein EAE98_003109 [Botrytis deweyae]KAF7935064.1 hypothetical protein EAE98_003109 [Botrytis deweyae]
MATPSYDPRTDAIDAWSAEANPLRRSPSHPEGPRCYDANIIQIPDPPIFNPIPYSKYPDPHIGICYAEWEEEMKEKLKAYSDARFSIRMAYVLSRLGEKPRAYLEVRMRVHEKFEFRNTDEMFEVLGKVYGVLEKRANENVGFDTDDVVAERRKRS